MKSDINLLYKRKVKKYSSQKLAVIILVFAAIAGLLYAGIALPAQALAAAKLQVASLQGQLITSTTTEQELQQKTEQFDTLTEQLETIQSLSSAKSDISSYLEAVENSLPTTANLTQLSLSGTTLSLNGVAANDTVIATFCVKLRETGLFQSVVLETSTVSTGEESESTAFSVTVTLASSLDPAIEETDETAADETTEAEATASAEATQEVSQ